MARFDNLGMVKPVKPQMGPKVPNAPTAPTVPNPAAGLQKQVGQIHSATGGAFQPQTGLPPGGGAITPGGVNMPTIVAGGVQATPPPKNWTPSKSNVKPISPPTKDVFTTQPPPGGLAIGTGGPNPGPTQPGPAAWGPTSVAPPKPPVQPPAGTYRGGPGSPGYAPPGWVPKTETTAEAFAGTGVQPSTGKAFGSWYDPKSPLKVDPNTGKRLPNGWLWNPTTGKPHQVLSMTISAMQQQASPTDQPVAGGPVPYGESGGGPPTGDPEVSSYTAEGLESYQPTFRDQPQTSVPQWQQEMMFPDQGPQQNLVAEMGHIPSQTPDYTGRDARFVGADMDVIPPGQTPNMVGMDPREMQANAPEIRQDAQGNYVEIANPYGMGTTPDGGTGTGGVLPPNYVEPTKPGIPVDPQFRQPVEQPVPTMDPVHGDHFDDTGEVEVPTPTPTPTTTGDDTVGDDNYWDHINDAVNRVNGNTVPGGDVIEPLSTAPVEETTAYEVPQAAPVEPPPPPRVQPPPLQDMPSRGGGPQPELTQPGTIEDQPQTDIQRPTAQPTRPGELLPEQNKTLQSNIDSLGKSDHPVDAALGKALTGVLEQGADIDVESLVPRLKTERERLSGMRETAKRRVLADLARRGFQLGGDQEAAVLAELEREVTTATSQSFRDIVNEERNRADQRLMQGAQIAGNLAGMRQQTELGQQELAVRESQIAGQEAIQKGQLGLQAQELGLQSELGRAGEERQWQQLGLQAETTRAQQQVAKYQANTQQYNAETTRISQENDMLLRNLAENNKFQQFLMEMGFNKARMEATLQQAAQGQTAELLKILGDFQSSLGMGGAIPYN